MSLNIYISLNLQAEHILDLQKQLTLLDGNTRRESNGGLTEESITSMTPADKVCFYVFPKLVIKESFGFRIWTKSSYI